MEDHEESPLIKVKGMKKVHSQIYLSDESELDAGHILFYDTTNRWEGFGVNQCYNILIRYGQSLSHGSYDKGKYTHVAVITRKTERQGHHPIYDVVDSLAGRTVQERPLAQRDAPILEGDVFIPSQDIRQRMLRIINTHIYGPQEAPDDYNLELGMSSAKHDIDVIKANYSARYGFDHTKNFLVFQQDSKWFASGKDSNGRFKQVDISNMVELECGNDLTDANFESYIPRLLFQITAKLGHTVGVGYSKAMAWGALFQICRPCTNLEKGKGNFAEYLLKDVYQGRDKFRWNMQSHTTICSQFQAISVLLAFEEYFYQNLHEHVATYQQQKVRRFTADRAQASARGWLPDSHRRQVASQIDSDWLRSFRGPQGTGPLLQPDAPHQWPGSETCWLYHRHHYRPGSEMAWTT